MTNAFLASCWNLFLLFVYQGRAYTVWRQRRGYQNKSRKPLKIMLSALKYENDF